MPPALLLFLEGLARTLEARPLRDQADVVALCGAAKNRSLTLDSPDAAWADWILKWAMREPALVEAHARGGLDAAIALEGSVAYAHLPKRLVKWLKPAALRANWRAAEVERLAAALKAALRAGTPEARATFAAFAVGAKRQGRKALPGLGKYGAAHLSRTACVAMGVAFPGAAFVEMGEGASVAKYAQLRAWGIDDADRLNAKTSRLLRGSITPSSHKRAEAYKGCDCSSNISIVGCLNAASSSADHASPLRSIPSRFTVAKTPAACAPPITPIREFGQLHMNRGE